LVVEIEASAILLSILKIETFLESALLRGKKRQIQPEVWI
jgi:hypothetical protein